MKTKYIFIILVYFVIQMVSLKQNNHTKIFVEDDKSLTFRSNIYLIPASLIDTKRQSKFTELKPDDNSSPLKLSKEQLGRFSW